MIFSFKTGYVTKGILIIEFWIFETIWKKINFIQYKVINSKIKQNKHQYILVQIALCHFPAIVLINMQL